MEAYQAQSNDFTHYYRGIIALREEKTEIFYEGTGHSKQTIK